MPLNQTARLHAVRTAWQRVQCEVAYVRVLMAASRFREALLREERFNPYHDELGRFTTADGAVWGGTGNDSLSGGGGDEQLDDTTERYSVHLEQQDRDLGGHTIRDHVGKTDDYLIDTLQERTWDNGI